MPVASTPIDSCVNAALASNSLDRIAIFDTRPQHDALSASLHAAFVRVTTSGSFILGAEVSDFEQRCATLLGTTHAIGVSSGSDALFLSLAALGIGPGDEVITTAFTFIATAEAILRTGATPVFADIDPNHLGLCPDSTRRMLSAKTRAVLYVHLYGNLGSIDEHARLCEEHGLFLVEDACQAFGARLGGRYAGTWGSVGCYSFFPTKPLGGLGDGGLCVTDDPALSTPCRRRCSRKSSLTSSAGD
jgi:dTDP-4-amino-4,6-dideoxygalactose transaminase